MAADRALLYQRYSLHVKIASIAWSNHKDKHFRLSDKFPFLYPNTSMIWFKDVFLHFHAVAEKKEKRKNSIEVHVYVENRT